MGEIIENEYGKIEILGKATKGKIKFKCFCGKIHESNEWKLKNGLTKSCGCSRRVDHHGKKFEKLTVIKFIKNKGWYCSCSCGGFRYADADALSKGFAKSCGCIHSSEGNQLYKNRLYKKWQGIVSKKIVSEEFKNFKVFENYINNELNAPIKEFRINRINDLKLMERGNIRLDLKKHKETICGIEHIWCVSCKRYVQNSDKFWTERGKSNNSSCKQCIYKKKIKTKFNLNYTDYLEMVKKCERKCEICKCNLRFLTSSKNTCVDHCHKTNKVRGILCSSCNCSLGMFNDNIELIKRSIDYLKEGDTEHKYNRSKKIKIHEICPISNLSENLVCDHNHKTGYIRGNIDNNINLAIGLMKDSVKILENAIIYLEKERN